eukprot:758973-Hanusia_phi.AAC.1
MHGWSQPAFNQLLVANSQFISIDDSGFLEPNAQHERPSVVSAHASSPPCASKTSKGLAHQTQSSSQKLDDTKPEQESDEFFHTEGPFVRVLPRAGEQQVERTRRPAELTKQTLRPYLALSQAEAA